MTTVDWINDLVRDNVRALKPYQSARRLGGNGHIWLNANELPDALSMNENGALYNRYPEAQPSLIIERYAKYAGVLENEVIATRGADEGIELLMRAFCEPNKDAILYCPPTYGMYKVSAETFGISQKTVPLTADFELDLEAIEQSLDNVKLLFICSPNNPTGNLIDKKSIEAVLEMTNQRTIVVVDEAYIEFAKTETMVSLLKKYPHLVILRTLSKAFGLAGIRLGFTIASETIIETLNKVIAPYPLSLPIIPIALEALSDQGLAKVIQNVNEIILERERLTDAFLALNSVEKVYQSEANYLLVAFKEDTVFNQLASQGIITRDQSYHSVLKNTIRITIGSNAENEALIHALKNI